MIGWKPIVVIIALGVASLLFSLLSPAKSSISGAGPTSVGLRQSSSVKTTAAGGGTARSSYYQDFLKLLSDRSRGENHGPRTDKLAEPRKHTVLIRTEPPMEAPTAGELQHEMDLATDPPHNEEKKPQERDKERKATKPRGETNNAFKTQPIMGETSTAKKVKPPSASKEKDQGMETDSSNSNSIKSQSNDKTKVTSMPKGKENQVIGLEKDESVAGTIATKKLNVSSTKKQAKNLKQGKTKPEAESPSQTVGGEVQGKQASASKGKTANKKQAPVEPHTDQYQTSESPTQTQPAHEFSARATNKLKAKEANIELDADPLGQTLTSKTKSKAREATDSKAELPQARSKVGTEHTGKSINSVAKSKQTSTSKEKTRTKEPPDQNQKVDSQSAREVTDSKGKVAVSNPKDLKVTKTQIKVDVEPPEIAMIEQLELATDSPPHEQSFGTSNEKPKRHQSTYRGSSHLKSPKKVTSFEQVDALVDDNLPNTRLTLEGQIDWSYYDAIELYHTRKAGGTSLFTWAKKIAQKHGLQVHQQEGNCFDPRDARYVNRHVLIFTSLRPPVERALSSYEYDVVQTSKMKNLTLREFCERADEVNNHGRNEKNVWQYKSYGRPTGKRNRTQRKKQKEGTKVSRGWVWQCHRDCYSKWFGGWPTANFEADVITAVKRLNDLEVVWMKNLENPDYMDWLLHRFDATDIPLPQKRVTANKAKKNYTQEEMDMLRNANEKDQWLYEALRRKWSRITNLTLV